MFIDKTSLHLCMATKWAKNMYIIFGIKPGKELTSSAYHQLGFPFIPPSVHLFWGGLVLYVCILIRGS